MQNMFPEYSIEYFGGVLRPEWSYTAGLLSLLGEPPNADDSGATVGLGIASPKP